MKGDSDKEGRRYVSMPTLARMYDVSPASVRRWKNAKDFPAPIFISPNCARYELVAVERWFREKRGK